MSEIVEGYQSSDTVNELQNQSSDQLENSPKLLRSDQNQSIDQPTVSFGEQSHAPFQGEVSQKPTR